MKNVTLAATQMACSWEIEANIERAEALIREAAGQGANIVLIQELFETPYFCIDQDTRHLDLAKPFEGHPTLARMSRLAAELAVVLPVSFFERANTAFFNSVAMRSVTRRNTTLIPVIPGLKCGKPGMRTSVSVSAGISGSPKVLAVWP